MKRLCACLLALIMVIGSVGCSSKPHEQTNDTTESSQTDSTEDAPVQKLEVSLLKDGKFAVTGEQFAQAYKSCLNNIYSVSFIGENEENDGYDYDVTVGFETATLSFSKSGKDKSEAVESKIFEVMDTVSVVYVGDDITQITPAFVALVNTLNPDMNYAEAKNILLDMVTKMEKIENDSNTLISKREIDGVTYSFGTISNLMLVLTASVDPNVTISSDNNSI